MANATQPLNLTDFTGGLNKRANEFSLAESESPDMLNVEIDPRMGVGTRKGWERWNTVDVTADTWNPRLAYVHELASGVDVVLVTNNGKVLKSTNGTFTVLEKSAASTKVVAATDHLADFASWGDDVYMVAGGSELAAKWNGVATYATELTAAAAANWNNNLLAPVGGVFPKAELIASHGGGMWVAGTTEDGVAYPNRIRWSHPNQPADWALNDKLDILEGGGRITAIVSQEDHLLVFKQKAVFAVYGYDGESQQFHNVSRTAGALNRKCVARSESATYFVSWPQGVFEISKGSMKEVSEALRPAFTSSEFAATASANMWLGWLNQRLWFSAPYSSTGDATDAKVSFVFDPTVGNGAWTMFSSALGSALGPFAQGSSGAGSYDQYGFDRTTPNAVRVDVRDAAIDDIDGEDVGFESSYTTRWLHTGWPDLKKRWRRPTFIAREETSAYLLTVSVFTDYSEGTPRRRFTVPVASTSGAALYDDSEEYDDGVMYGSAAEGSQLVRASGLGQARSIQLKIDGEVGKRWGLDGIVLKYRARRFT